MPDPPHTAAELPAPTRGATGPRAPGPRDYLLTLGLVMACTAVAFAMERHFAPANLTMIYLLGVVVSAIAFGRRPAIVSAIASVAAFDFLFVPPRFTFEVDDTQYLVTFAVMLVVAVVIGTLTAWLREQRELATRRERRTAALYRLSRDLSSCRSAREVATAATERIAEILAASVALALAWEDGRLRAAAGAVESLTPQVMADAQDARQRPARLRVPADPREPILMPVDAGVTVAGVLVLFPASGVAPDTEDLHLLRALSHQTGLALERCRLTEETERARLEAETERTRSALLSSVSHDLRTPLSAITGAASQLRAGAAVLSDGARVALADGIVEEAGRLDRLIGNLLDMTRLESGMPRLQKEWHSLEDVLGAVLGRLEESLAGRPVRVELPDDLPLVPLDAVLFGQVLVNLLGNAARYSPTGSAIEIRATAADGRLHLEVADRGPGFAPEELDRVFEKFYRGRAAAHQPGTGLGLAISRAAVEAHGGKLIAENRPGGGARLVLSVPLGPMPPAVAPEPHDATSPVSAA